MTFLLVIITAIDWSFWGSFFISNDHASSHGHLTNYECKFRESKVEQVASMSSLFDNVSWDLDFVSSLICTSTNETIQSFEQCFRIKTNCKSLNFGRKQSLTINCKTLR